MFLSRSVASAFSRHAPLHANTIGRSQGVRRGVVRQALSAMPEVQSNASALDPVPESVSFPENEMKIVDYWKNIDAFKTSLKKSAGRPEYVFMDGPPFATGLPHYGHLLAGTIKDVVTRYAHQTGHHVTRRFGWDCHGLPIEFEIEQQLGINTKDQVLALGIDKYNAECRSIVMRYSKEWQTTVERMGRWIDFEDDYKTMDTSFMESVWWVFSQLNQKNLVYRGFKVMPYSTACTTPLSNFEAKMNYKDTSDPSIVVTFPLIDDADFPDTALLAWTTTPWTLPSNLAVCVHPDFDYVQIEDKETKHKYIILPERVDTLYGKKSKGKYTVLKTFKGKDLGGKRFEPCFRYFYEEKKDHAFIVMCDNYVTKDSGTGIVQTAPAFGEDDFRVAIAHGVVSREDVPCPVDDCGRFTPVVSDYTGLHIKEADKKIIQDLKERGRLIRVGTIVHSYPYCWRSETPLIYKAVPSWFVRVESIKDRLLKNNLATYWVPSAVQEKRFNNWLEDARDWAVSRNRYWGTPLPIWVSDDYEEVVVIGSIEELEKLSGVSGITDLHRDKIDHITIPSKQGKGVLRRVEEVFDCWFESGSMPYASVHYPFENKEWLEKHFPADFIAEGLDQTRGWFYTLLVLGTALFDSCPFKNNIVNGLVLAADGKKMSKRLKNYPDPRLVIDRYGADALRLYLVNSPVVRAEPLRFKEQGVRDVIRDVFLPWYNAYRFFVQNAQRVEADTGIPFSVDNEPSTNVFDHWIVASLQGLIKFVREEMAAYRLYTVVPRLLHFIEDLTNWYVRMNRNRLKGLSGDDADRRKALSSLFTVLYNLSKLMAPFTPFQSELTYMNLHKLLPAEEQEESVHYKLIPQVMESLVDEKVESQVRRMQTVIELGRALRDRFSVSLKTPLRELVVACANQDVADSVNYLAEYIKDEMNVRDLVVGTDDLDKYVKYVVEPDNRALGQRLGKAFAPVAKAIRAMGHDEIQTFLAKGEISLEGQVITKDEMKIVRQANIPKDSNYAGDARDEVVVLLDVQPDEDLRLDGLAREVVNRVQKLRKQAGLEFGYEVDVYYSLDEGAKDVRTVLDTRLSAVCQPLRVERLYALDSDPMPGSHIIRESAEIGSEKLELSLARRVLRGSDEAIAADFGQEHVSAVNLYLASLDSAHAKKLLAAADGKLSVSIDGTKVVLVQGRHF